MRETEPGTAPEPAPEPEPAPVSDAAPEPEPMAESEPVAATEAEPAPTPVPAPAPTPATAPAPAPTPAPAPAPMAPGRKRIAVGLVVVIALTLAAVAGIVTMSSSRAPAPVARVPAKDTSKLLASYRGLGTWVDIFDTRAWADPAGAVADMASHGVRTLYLETGNSHQKTAIFDPIGTAAFISAAHAHGMRVVAWYLPYMTSVSTDLTRVVAAIDFRTADGQGFDSFALDIESAAVKPLTKRIARLQALSVEIRAAAGASYPLGAIIPSPVGLARKTGYWDVFPYTALAQTYDVFLPMGYYTYHGRGATGVYADAVGNVDLIRAQPGCAAVPIHLIGGISNQTKPTEVAAFVQGIQATHCIGASLYGWAGTTTKDWQALELVNP
jgi:hypothetical protein